MKEKQRYTIKYKMKSLTEKAFIAKNNLKSKFPDLVSSRALSGFCITHKDNKDAVGFGTPIYGGVFNHRHHAWIEANRLYEYYKPETLEDFNKLIKNLLNIK